MRFSIAMFVLRTIHIHYSFCRVIPSGAAYCVIPSGAERHHAVIPSGAERSRGICCYAPQSDPNSLRFGADFSTPRSLSRAKSRDSSRAPVEMTAFFSHKSLVATSAFFIVHYLKFKNLKI
jgi:hypothetical protein